MFPQDAAYVDVVLSNHCDREFRSLAIVKNAEGQMDRELFKSS